MIFRDVIGWMATALLFFAFVPQSYKVLKLKSAKGVSKITFPIVFIGSSMWAIYGSIGGFIQPWICNTVIVIMMIPTVYYILRNDIKFMISVFVMGLSTTLASLIIFILVKISVIDKVSIEWLSWMFVIIAGAGTAISYIPQLFNIIKTKKIGNVSVLTLTIVSLANICWIIYWLFSYLNPKDGNIDYTCILSTIWSILSFIWQLPVIYLYISQKKTKKL